MTTELNDVLTRVEALARQTPETIARHEVPRVEAESTAYEGRIRVAMAGGEVTEVWLHATALRLTNAELGDQLAAAFNDVLRAHTDALTAAMAEHQVDFDGLAGQIAVLRDDANRALTACLGGIAATVAQVGRS